MQKKMVRLHFIKNVLHYFTYSTSEIIYMFFRSGFVLFSWHVLVKKPSVFVEGKCHVEKRGMPFNLIIQDIFHVFSQILVSLQE